MSTVGRTPYQERCDGQALSPGWWRKTFFTDSPLAIIQKALFARFLYGKLLAWLMGAMTALTHFIPITFLFLGTLSVRLIDIGMIVGHGIASFYKTA
jgi:hypothetical protein